MDISVLKFIYIIGGKLKKTIKNDLIEKEHPENFYL